MSRGDFNDYFTRSIMRDIHKEVKALFPAFNLKKDAWVYHYDRQDWEFQTVPREGGPVKFVWNGHAHNAAEARYNGWCAYLRHVGIEGY